jgi:hypothetical protein
MAQRDATFMYPNEMIKMWLKEHTQQELDGTAASRSRKANYLADLVCLSHLRWDFVYQRPQHLLSRAAQTRRVFFIEEPVLDEGSMRLDIRETDSGVKVVVPRLPEGLQSEVAKEAV